MFIRKPFKTTLLSCASALGAMAALHAQPVLAQETAATPDTGATNKIFDVSEVVVTGTSEARAKFNTPYSISTIKESKIADLAPHSVTDMLRATPGITVEASGGEGGSENVVIRGLPWAGWRLIDLTQDGMPLFESNTEKFMNADEFFRVDSSVQRAEVVRGGTAPIFSNNAAGGVVNFVTRHGTQTPEGAVTLETGSANRISADGYWSGPLAPKLLGVISGSWRRDDGLRDPGFSGGDKGGQIAVGATYLLEHGKIFADVKYLDDHGAFYTAIPLTDPRPGATFGQSLGDLIDPNTGTLTSARFRNVAIRTLNGTPGGAVANRDLADGIHPKMTTATLGGHYDWDNGFSVTDTYRHTQGTLDFNGIFNGATPSDSTTFLNNQLAAAKAGFADVASLRYVLAGGNTPYDPATTRGLVMTNSWNSIHTRLRFDANDLKVNKSLETGAGRHDLTFGVYASDYSFAQTELLNAMLMNVKNQPDALDIQALNAAGQVVGSVTENGFVSYGAGSQNGRLTGKALAFYAEDSWHVTPAWEIDAGFRTVDRRQKGVQGVLGTQNLAPTGPLAARNVQGVVRYVPHSEKLTGTSYTVGTAYTFSPSLNVFGRFTKSFSYPRFDTILGAATLPGTTTPLPVATVYQAETGVKYAASNFQLFAVGFWSKFNKLNGGTQVADANGAITNSNILFDTTTLGVEMEGVWTPTEHVEINSTVMLQKPNIDSVTTLTGLNAATSQDTDTPRVPRYQVTLEPAYTFTAGPLSGRVYTTLYAIGKRYQDFSNLSILPAYATVDLGLSLRNADGLEGRLLVRNLANSDGLTEGNARASVIGTGAPGEATVGRPVFGRNFVISVTKRW